MKLNKVLRYLINFRLVKVLKIGRILILFYFVYRIWNIGVYRLMFNLSMLFFLKFFIVDGLYFVW